MQLETNIQDLLYRYECVIIPGFGAFLTQHQSATIEKSSNTFYPPRKVITFNRQLQTNDGLLADYVASLNNCSYEVALQKIRSFARNLSLQLSAGETVVLKNIGEFCLNKENSVQFAPSNKENFNSASFGLTTFSSSQVYRKVAEGVNASPPLFIPHKSQPIPYMKYAAVALIALTISGFGGIKLYEGQIKSSNFSERQKANALLENKIQEATFIIENPLPILELTLPKKEGKYHVIAGAFRIERNATKKLDQLLKKGFAAKAIGANKYGLHMIVYSSHDNRKEATKSLRKIKKNENKDAWILTKDLAK